MPSSNKAYVPVFNVKKKHAWRDQILRWVSILMLVLVLLGTLVWILLSANPPFEKIINDVLSRIKPEIKKETKIKTNSKEEELRNLIENDKVLEIETLANTVENDISVKAKNGPTILFSTKKSLTDQVSTLQTLLTKAKIDNKAIKKVDFRFEKIVVEY